MNLNRNESIKVHDFGEQEIWYGGRLQRKQDKLEI